jgi:modulator of FtsH protease HflK
VQIKNYLINILKNDPWKKNSDSPPDLDELLVKWRNKMFKNTPNKKNGKDDAVNFGIGLVFTILFVLWVISGFFIVEPSEKAVVLRLGKFNKTLDAGPHWIPRFLDTKDIVNVNNVYQFAYNAQMLTKDENIVDVELSVQYQVLDPKKYLFNVTTPIASIKEATASALRQVVGHTTLDGILTIGREEARTKIEKQLVTILDIYQPGLYVVDVNLQPAKPPSEVTEAFDDAIKAREDQQKYINQAKAYFEKVIPISEGKASRMLQEAEAYKAKVTLDAKAEVAKFLAILKEHARSPEVTDKRLYYTTLEKVFSNTSKIMVDTNGSNNMLYLPLDKMLNGKAAKDVSALDSEIIATSVAAKIIKDKNSSRQAYQYLSDDDSRSRS